MSSAPAKYDTRDGEVVVEVGPVELQMAPDDAEEFAAKLIRWAAAAREEAEDAEVRK